MGCPLPGGCTPEVYHLYYIELNREARLLVNKEVGLLDTLWTKEMPVVYHSRSKLSREAVFRL